MNTKIILGSLLGAALVYAALAACSGKTDVASAGDTVVQTATENCDKTYQPSTAGAPRLPDGGVETITGYYAEHAYPGMTKEQLAGHVTNWNAVTSATPFAPPGYELIQQDVIWTRDGFAGAGCQAGTTTTFIYAP